MKGRSHDNRHTLITDLAESGAGDQTIMNIAGHVSKQMLRHYNYIRMEAKRNALEAIVKPWKSVNFIYALYINHPWMNLREVAPNEFS